jgi:DnaK suppressor protein
MARHDALKRLHQSLLARRADLRKKLSDDLNSLKNSEATGDEADAAFDAAGDEMNSQLAELEARELSQIEKALLRLKQGTYGLCEVCQARIPVGRLNMLPFCTLCVDCQREMEDYPGSGRANGGDWAKVYDTATPLDDPRVNLAALEMDLSK